MGKQTQKDKAELANSDQDQAKIKTEEDSDLQESSAEEKGVEEQADFTLEEVLEKLAEEKEGAARARDDLLRVQAEMQNMRRRTEQDIEKAHKYGQEKFSTELLTVMDNLERALAAASDHEDETVKAIYEGVDLTLKSFTDCFNRFHIGSVDPMGEPFDPQLQQAVTILENPDVEPNTVIEVMQKGYTLHGRVIRPAMVVVSKEPESENKNNDK
ncbi:MAG: nucleotide exchange factor GrpE [Gammaproteobacteria bacterium]|jgi:molecular chaperone GrpE|uniref:GrpE protein homolog n=1 Tax=marine metagenome TaxID=408172 RepID=A0A381QJP4_9ZZZZ|nr:nucleotide exchange factor GrpE [Gammaproteobacteria bacterium]|tara:strand:+ start:5591 stop:6232 length:642 start_codon:yes stop_codon:yes gene_type:complete